MARAMGRECWEVTQERARGLARVHGRVGLEVDMEAKAETARRVLVVVSMV